jgi:hypothetical protein
MKKLILLSAALAVLAPASADAAAARKRPRYSTATTTIGTLLDDPRARVIVDRHIPNTSTDTRITFARALTLKGIQRFSQGKITDNQLAAVDADLAKLK